MKHVVMFSGGVGSWAAAKRVAQQYGTKHLTLLFTDTLMEDEDLYRFLGDAAFNVGVRITRLVEGRTPWQLFKDRNFLGNSRVAVCSHELKQRPASDWLNAHCDPADTVVYLGIDWSEIHRYERTRDIRAKQGWTYKAPLCDPPYLSKTEMLAQLREAGVRPPRLYGLGFSHNNCGGFCVRAGKGHFALLLQTMPERYAYHEAQEQKIRKHLGADVSILADEIHGKKQPLTMRALRERIEGGKQPDMFEIGGCGCFVDEEDA